MKITKAVIPVAGLGTRFLPATKTVPKEMLPIVDKPTLLYIMEEIVAADISHVVLIAGRGKSAIEDFFDTSYEVEDTLERAGRTSS
jgi:UTP--glucose-1-phosphate uridylyltransferase